MKLRRVILPSTSPSHGPIVSGGAFLFWPRSSSFSTPSPGVLLVPVGFPLLRSLHPLRFFFVTGNDIIFFLDLEIQDIRLLQSEIDSFAIDPVIGPLV